MTEICDYCRFKPQIIGKVETFDKDFQSLCRISGLYYKDTWVKEECNSGHAYHANQKINDESYFSQLNDRQRRNLFRLYRLDFEMFGYSWQKDF